jgi:hypothetical protein
LNRIRDKRGEQASTGVSPALAQNEHVTAAEIETQPETDYSLAQKAAQGEMGAFEQLYQRHNRRVYSL